MNGMSREGLVGWNDDPPKGPNYPNEYRNLVLAYRKLRDNPETKYLAESVRIAGNAQMRLAIELEEALRKGREGKVAQSWDDFVRPFAAMDAAQLAEWISNFKQGVVEMKDRIKREARGQA